MNVTRFILPLVAIATLAAQFKPVSVAFYTHIDPDQSASILTAIEVKPIQPFRRVELG